MSRGERRRSRSSSRRSTRRCAAAIRICKVRWMHGLKMLLQTKGSLFGTLLFGVLMDAGGVDDADDDGGCDWVGCADGSLVWAGTGSEGRSECGCSGGVVSRSSGEWAGA